MHWPWALHELTMKRCPDCRRNYYDETLLYCLDDGTALLEGPGSEGGRTAVLSSGEFADEARTRPLISSTGGARDRIATADVATARATPAGRNKVAIGAIVAAAVAIAVGVGVVIYKYRPATEAAAPLSIKLEK